MDPDVFNGFPTHIDRVGELLRISLQKDHKLGMFVENYLMENIKELKSPRFVPKIDDLLPGMMGIGRYDDNQYYRVKILDQAPRNNVVNVLFIDYGNHAVLPLADIRLLNYEVHKALLNIPPLAITCFLENVAINKPWNDDEFTTLKKLVLYEERQCAIRQLPNRIKVVNIFFHNANKRLTEMILENDLGTQVSDAELVANVRKLSGMPGYEERRPAQASQQYIQRVSNVNENYIPERGPPREASYNFSSSHMLPIDTSHNAYVSHMEDGPYSFSIQLKSSAEDALPRLSRLLKGEDPVLNTHPLLPGKMVMTQVKNGNFRRSIVMNVRRNVCQVYHMDYGSTEEVPFSEIYQLPSQAHHAPAMALRFCLADVKSLQITDSAKAYFQDLLLNKQVLIKVAPQESEGPLLQYCEMFYEGRNVKDILMAFSAPLEYTSQHPPRGKDIKVTVSHIDSPSLFFIQYNNKLDVVNRIQEAVNAHCKQQNCLRDLSGLSISTPIAACFEDNVWYRGLIVGLNPNTAQILYVDYGNRSEVTAKQLCHISRDLVTKWRSQAVECCLQGFENESVNEIDPEVIAKMEETLNQNFNMTPLLILPGNRYVVELVDELGGKLSEKLKLVKSHSSSYPSGGQIHLTHDKPTHDVLVTEIETGFMRNKCPIDHWKTDSIKSPRDRSRQIGDQGQRSSKGKGSNLFVRPSLRPLIENQTKQPYTHEHDDRCDDIKPKAFTRQSSFDKPRFSKGEDQPRSSWDDKNTKGNDAGDEWNSFSRTSSRDSFSKSGFPRNTTTDEDNKGFGDRPRRGPREQLGGKFDENSDVRKKSFGGRPSKSDTWEDGDGGSDMFGKSNGARNDTQPRWNVGGDNLRNEERTRPNNRGVDRPRFRADERVAQRNHEEGWTDTHEGQSNCSDDIEAQSKWGPERDNERPKRESGFRKFNDTKESDSDFSGNKFSGKRNRDQFEGGSGNKFGDRRQDDGESSGNRFGGRRRDDGEFGGNRFGGRKQDDEESSGGRFGGRRRDDGEFGGNRFGGRKQDDEESSGGRFGGRRRDDGEFGGNRFGGRKQDDEESSGGRFGGRRRDDGEGGGNRFSRDKRRDDIESGGNRFGDRRRDDGESGGNRFGDRRRDGESGGNRFGGDRRRDDGGERRGGRFRDADGGQRESGRFNKDDFRKKRFDSDMTNSGKPPNSSFGGKNDAEDWEVEETPVKADCGVAETPLKAVKPQVGSSYPTQKISTNAQLQVTISSVVNPHLFYVQEVKCGEELDQLRTSIDNLAQGLRNVKEDYLAPGVPVLAKFSEDHALYRGTVKYLAPPYKARVLFVDYGNAEDVALSEIYCIPPEILDKAPLAVRCTLRHVNPLHQKWPEDVSIIEEFFNSEEVLTMSVGSVKIIDGELVVSAELKSPDGISISQKLIEAGLAVSASGDAVSSFGTAESSSVPVQVSSEGISVDKVDAEKWIDRMDLLVGQHLYGEVLEISGEDAFVIRISDAKVVTLASLTDRQSFSAVVSHSKAIIQVEGIHDDRLKVSLFDLDGVEKGPFNDEKTEPRKISPFCAFAVVRSVEHIYVSHIEGTDIYIQRHRDADKLNEMLEETYNFYNDTTAENIEWSVGEICCARCLVDENWYRAEILSINENCNVKYIDYGNCEEVPKENLRKLDERFYFAHMALNVSLPVELAISDSELLELVSGEKLTSKFINKNGKWFIDPCFTSGKRLCDVLMEKSCATPIADSPFEEVNCNIGSDLTAGSKVPILVAHADSPTMFWVHMQSHINRVDELQEKLQMVIESASDATDSDVVFAAQYSADSVWYRATRVNEETLRFIDYGNTDILVSPKKLPDDMIKPVSGYAVPMYLCAQPLSGDWTSEAIKEFEIFIEQQNIIAEIISVDFKIVVDLCEGEQRLSKILIDAGHATYCDFIPEVVKKYSQDIGPDTCPRRISIEEPPRSINNECDSKIQFSEDANKHSENREMSKVYVIHSNSLNDFYIQEDSKTELIDKIQNKLLEVENSDKSSDIKIGGIYAVKDEDGLWYRAKVISIEPEFNVRFIDYGNTCTSDDLRQLPNDIISEEPLAVHCSLGVEETPEAYSEFVKLINGGLTPFNMSFLSSGAPHIVQLLDDNGTDILGHIGVSSRSRDTLVQKDSTSDRQKVFITHAFGPDCFFTQTEEQLSKLEELSMHMATAENYKRLERILEGDLIAALYQDDSCWYRGEVLSFAPDVVVRFIDYGNNAVVTDYRELPPEVKEIECLTTRCSLQLPEGFDYWPEGSHELFLKTCAMNPEGMHMRYISQGAENIVELYLNDEEVTKGMIDILTSNTDLVNEPEEKTNLSVDKISANANNLERGYITHINSISEFYIQKEDCADLLRKIQGGFSVLENNINSKPDCGIGSLIAAKFVDEAWYRGQILNIDPEIRVRFIDYGNECNVSEIAALPEELLHIPPVAMKCSLELMGKQLKDNAKELFDKLCGDAETLFHFRILSVLDGVHKVEIILDNKNVLSDLCLESSGTESVEETLTVAQESSVKDDSVPEFVAKHTKGYISHINSACDFFIQEENASETLDVIQATLDVSCSEGKESIACEVGDIVVAKYDCEDWCRAEVIETTPDIKVRFIDYGNEATVSEISTLPSQLLDMPPVALRCSLENADDAINKQFIELCGDPEKLFEFHIVSIKNGLNIVKVLLEGEEMCVKLKSSTKLDNLEVNPDIADQKLNKAEVNTSPIAAEFGDLNDSQAVGETSKIECEEESEKPSANKDLLKDVGDTCSNAVDSAGPDDLQAGGETSKTECQEESEKPSGNEKPINVDVDTNLNVSDSPECDNLNDPQAGKETIKIEDKKVVSTPSKELKQMDYDKVVTHKLVSSVNSINDFYIRKQCEESELLEKILMEADLFDDPPGVNVNDILAGKSLEGSWFRCKVIETGEDNHKVLLIDHGYQTNVTALKELPTKLNILSPMVLHCCLFRPVGISSWPKEADDKFIKMCEDVSGYTVINDSVEPIIVKLKTPEGDLSDLLEAYCKETCSITVEDLNNSKSNTLQLENENSDSLNAENNSTLKQCSSLDSEVSDSVQEEPNNSNVENESSHTKTKSSTPERPASKPVKSLAEIKANAKAKIVTRSQGASPVDRKLIKNESRSPSEPQLQKIQAPERLQQPLFIRTSSLDETPVPGCLSNPSSPVERSSSRASKLSSSSSPLQSPIEHRSPRHQVSEKIVPGSISGVVMDNVEESEN